MDSQSVFDRRYGHVDGKTRSGEPTTPVQYFEVSGDGKIRLNLSWDADVIAPNLDLELRNHFGQVVATSQNLTGTSESISYDVSGIDYPESYTWSARVSSLTTSSDYQLDIRSPRPLSWGCRSRDLTGRFTSHPTTPCRAVSPWR